VIIVGCGGFIGSHLAEQLLDDGRFEVLGFDVSDAKCAHLFEFSNFRFIRCHLDAGTTHAVLEPLIDEVDAIFSLAAVCNPSQYISDPVTTIRSNFIDAFPLIDLCTRKRKWLIHASTCEVYGRTVASYLAGNDYSDPGLFEQREDETPMVMGPTLNQRWSYAAAKALMERYVYANHTQYGLPFTIFRPYNWFGPRMDFIPGRDGEGLPRVLACFMHALLDDRPLQLVDGGKAYRTVTYIGDGIDALTRMLEVPDEAKNKTFNIGNRDNEIRIHELALLMRDIYAEITGDSRYRSHPIENIGSQVFYGPGYEDCDRRLPDISRAVRLLGWKPKVPLRETLLLTMTAFHEAYGGGQKVYRFSRAQSETRQSLV
jgi:UDP-apiose/xylose synthase